jgi:hypothetical protein
MAFADEIREDVEAMHADWTRADIVRYARTRTAISVTGSTPSFTEAPVTITGVLTVIDTALNETIFGGMEDCDAVLMLLPAVALEYQDEVAADGVRYRVEEIRVENVSGVAHQKFCRLKKVS